MNDSFNFTTNSYTCQETGTYAFYSALLSPDFEYSTADILLDDQLVVTIVPDDGPPLQTAAMAVMTCQTGSEVKVAWKFSGYGIVGSETSRTSTFTAFLIGKHEHV